MTLKSRITLRFDGLDAENHAIDLFAFGESMQGVARIIGTIGHFAATQQYSRYFRAHGIKVLAKEARENCFSLDVALEFMKQHQMLSGSFPAVLAGLVAWVIHRASGKTASDASLQSEMLATIKEMAAQNEERERQLLNILEAMAADLRPSVRKAFTPIGSTCRTMTIISNARKDIYDESDKASLIVDDGEYLTDLIDWVVLITELDLERGTCKARVVEETDETKRINAIVTDPMLKQPNSPYSLAMAAGEPLLVKAKGLIQEGELKKLYISDVGI